MTKPDDIDVTVHPALDDSNGFSTYDDPCTPFALANGTVSYVSPSTPPAALANFFDRADGNATTVNTCVTAVTASPILFQATRKITVSGPVEVEGGLYVNSLLRVGNGHGSTFAGDLISGGKVRIRDGNTVAGDVLAGSFGLDRLRRDRDGIGDRGCRRAARFALWRLPDRRRRTGCRGRRRPAGGARAGQLRPRRCEAARPWSCRTTASRGIMRSRGCAWAPMPS